MSDPFQVKGLEDFARGMRELERTLPGDLEREMLDVGRMLLPAMRDATPKKSGALAAETKIVAVRGKPTFKNAKPQANAIHWGRAKWPNARSPRAVTSIVAASRFVWGPLNRSHALIERELTPRINRLLAKRLQ